MFFMKDTYCSMFFMVSDLDKITNGAHNREKSLILLLKLKLLFMSAVDKGSHGSEYTISPALLDLIFVKSYFF